ncbi:MAG: ArsR/SmtB family transcription factor [Planctomycetota bacterium]|jgi:DNA-binding transcriptional ArsR family regulator
MADLTAGVFRALGDETRLALIARLACAAEPMTVTEAADCCGVHLSGVSRHLAALRDAGLVIARKDGREVRYTLDRDAFHAVAAALEGCCGRTKK